MSEELENEVEEIVEELTPEEIFEQHRQEIAERFEEKGFFKRLVEMFFLGNFHLPTRVRFAVRMDSAGVERAMAVMLQCLPEPRPRNEAPGAGISFPLELHADTAVPPKAPPRSGAEGDAAGSCLVSDQARPRH